MKHTEMPASRLTANCIWNSFRNSGKRHLILTGTRSSGKSTLLGKLFQGKMPGLTSWAEPQKAVFLRDNLSGETVQVGSFNGSVPGTENRMGLTGDGFEKFGVSALEHLTLCGEPWVTVDEIGYLEAECREYIRALNRLLEQKNVAAVVRKQNIPLLNDLCRREDAFVVDLDDPFGNIGCVIMASGLGKRFGGNKLMADFGGQPMITRILDATEGIFTRRVVVTRSGEAAGLCRARGVETVLHDLPYRSDTVRLGLDALQEVERCMFAAADQPLLTADTVTSLALAAKNGSEFIWRTVFENEPGNPVVFPHWTFQELKNLPEGKGGNVVVKKHPEKLLTVSAGNRYELRDVDCPEDLEELLQVL